MQCNRKKNFMTDALVKKTYRGTSPCTKNRKKRRVAVFAYNFFAHICYPPADPLTDNIQIPKNVLLEKKAFDSESNTCVFEPHSVTFQEG